MSMNTVNSSWEKVLRVVLHCAAAALGPAVVLVLTAGLLAPVLGQYWEGVIDIGEYQAQVLCNPLSNKIYTSNYDANTVTIIDGATRQIIVTRSVSGEPRHFCLNTVSNKVYCLPNSGSRLAVIDGVTDSVKRLTIPHGGPSAFAFNSTLNRLYVGCDDEGTVVVVDGAADTILRELHLESRWVSTLFWNPVTNHLFCGTFADTLFVVDCQTDEVRARWFIAPFDVWCYSTTTGRVYAGDPSTVWAFSPHGDSVLATIPRGVQNICAVPFPDKVYIEDGWIYVLDGSTGGIVDTIRHGGGGMVCDTSKGKVYSVGGVVIDARADTLLATVPLPAFAPYGIGWNPLDGRVYVTDFGGDSVYVLRDTMPGIAEAGATPGQYRPALLVRRSLSWPGPGDGQILDVTGRRVADVRPGVNDVGRLPAGVYTVVNARVGAATRFVKLD